ncbi:PREDICTED: microtubule-associated protein TORTIFOLIA1-like [Brassica oleracea var. oleracea]|uniref:TORTIFOLIA1/SINE1-2 N-terminal domain-containing protein n=1 Tax=Brassica oleracea var. oleracea TaxID=109376 RepID=A0A0D3E1V1_BRAOL|nr:PREDICTED: microtubule-associated protein TORTIFOLIA1-like [Brassica oleracea var. oleracea]
MEKSSKQKMSELLTKLGDRDTFTMAAKELDVMARNIDPTSGNLQSFISVVLSADSGDKPAVRKHCIHLLAVLSVSLPPNSLSPHLSKILSRVTRRLRDPDSSVRSACVAAVSAIASRTTKPPFASAFVKPLSEALFTEQEVNAQIGAGLCLAAAIDAAEDPDPVRLGTTLLPRLEKLVKCNAFKAKPAGVAVIGSVIGAGGVSGAAGGLKGLVDCLVSVLSSEDWAARKAAAEALGRLAMVERNDLGEFKAKCLKIFEGKRYDKVKAVREVMNQMMEAWTQVPDLSEEVSPPRSNASSKGSGVASTPAKPRTREVNRSTPPGSSIATAARRRTSDPKNTSSVPSHIKSNVRRRLELKAGGGASVPSGEPLLENENTNEASHSNHEKIQKLGSVASSLTGDHVLSENKNSSSHCKGLEDMSLIRSQLVQIEQQQSNLMDLLQRFVGSSQHGMISLETRVQGLEIALDEISYDLAVTNGRMSNGSSRNNCCLIPPGSFITSKFWKKPDSMYSASRLATYRNRNAETMGMQDSRKRFNGATGFIVNPLAEIRPGNGSADLAHN